MENKAEYFFSLKYFPLKKKKVKKVYAGWCYKCACSADWMGRSSHKPIGINHSHSQLMSCQELVKNIQG